jgi:transcriptional regulator with XRE-family HTH domain
MSTGVAGSAKNNLASLLAENPALARRHAERAGLAEIAALLLQLRSELNLTQKEFAKRCGLPKSTISELENTANDGVTLRTIVKIAKGAGASLNLAFDLDVERAGTVTTVLRTDRYNFKAEIRRRRTAAPALAA